jgi:SAM-dependent methyltransferase
MEPTDENREIWDKVHLARHTAPPGAAGLPGPVRHSLADLAKKRVLHVRCRTGEATEELAGLGAVVTGVDPSEEELEVARERAPSILWVHAEPDGLPRELKRERFELVYCAPGTLEETRDLEALARGIRNALRAGGDLLVFDEHPVAWAVDGLMHWRDSYFGEGRWRLGQLVSAVARAGLAVGALEEYPARQGNVRRHDARVPAEFLLYARRP